MTKKNMKRDDKKGQVTIFIIIALLIVSGILVYFLWLGPTYVSPTGSGLQVENCMNDVIKESVIVLGKQAGYVKPELSYAYQGEKVPYLCYTNLYLQPCVNQNPFIKNNFEEQLTLATKDKIYKCFDNSLNELQRKGYEVSGSARNLTITIDSGKILAELDAPVVLSRDAANKFTTFKAEVSSQLYEVLMISTSIIQQESKYGDSDIDTLRLYYPNYDINKMKVEDGTTIYSVTDKSSNTEFQFATRSYAWPAGYGSDTGLVKKQ